MRHLRYFWIILFLSSPVQAVDIVIYSTTTDRVSDYRKSQSRSRYTGRVDVVILDTMDKIYALPSVQPRYWKHSSGAIVEMTQAEKDSVDADALNDLKQRRIKAVDNYSITIKELMRALTGFMLVTDVQIKDKIKQHKGLK